MSRAPAIDARAAIGSALPRSREDELDVLKALSIVAVVWIHGSGLLDSSSRTGAVGSIARFGVPVFITVWAYLFERSISREASPWPLVLRRFVSFLVPYVFWTAAFLLCARTYRGNSLWTFFNGKLGGYGWAGQYYLLILLQLVWVFPLVRHAITPRGTILICVLTVPAFAAIGYVLWKISLVDKIGFRPFVYWMPYVALGVTASRLPKPALDRRLLALAVALVLLPVLERQFLRSRGLATDNYVTPAVFLATVGVLYAIYVGCQGLRAPAPLLFVGRNTFGIFVLNPWFVHFGTLALGDRRLDTTMPLVSNVLMPLLSVGLIVAGCLAVTSLLRAAGLGILLGEWPARRGRPESVKAT